MSAWVSQPPAEDHEVSHFNSGNASLDRWIPQGALRAHRAGVSRTTVWTAPHERAVVAYGRAHRASSRSLSAGYSHVPGYLIGRLALDQALHGQGLGTQLLLDALERIVEAADRAGGRVIVVDAIDDSAHRFYRHHDFHGIEGSNRLVMKVATAAAILG